jgi:hypothetical protein
MLKHKVPPRLWDYGLVYDTTSWLGSLARSASALGLKSSLAKHVT